MVVFIVILCNWEAQPSGVLMIKGATASNGFLLT
jgi:hypothetical protein